MTKILFSNHDLPHFRWESLISGVFDCYGKYCDPLGMAVQDDLISYLSSENKEEFNEGKIVLSATIGVIAYRIRDEEYKEEQVLIKGLFENLKDARTPGDVMEIVDKCIDLFDKLDL